MNIDDLVARIVVLLGMSVHRQQWPSVNDLFIALCSDVGGLSSLRSRSPSRARAGDSNERTNPSIRRTDSGVETRLRGGQKSQTLTQLSLTNHLKFNHVTGNFIRL